MYDLVLIKKLKNICRVKCYKIQKNYFSLHNIQILRNVLSCVYSTIFFSKPLTLLIVIDSLAVNANDYFGLIFIYLVLFLFSVSSNKDLRCKDFACLSSFFAVRQNLLMALDLCQILGWNNDL